VLLVGTRPAWGRASVSLGRTSLLVDPLWESWDKEPFGRGRSGITQRILYGGRWWLPSSPGRGESSESKVALGLS
jgi:hypothetical protein